MACRQLCLWIGLPKTKPKPSKTTHRSKEDEIKLDISQRTVYHSNKKHVRHTLFIFVEPAGERLETCQLSAEETQHNGA